MSHGRPAHVGLVIHFVRSNFARSDDCVILRDLVARLGADQSQVVGSVQVLIRAKSIERIGDHATHIAGAANLKATGHRPEPLRRELDESSTITGNTQARDPDPILFC